MYFPDLSLCRYHPGPCNTDDWKVPLLAVGWLERDEPYSCGEVTREFKTRLAQLVEETSTLDGISFRGYHRCSLCSQSSEHLPESHLNIFLPGSGVVYIAPAGIAHYVTKHEYLPPKDFIRSALRCPEIGSVDYFERLQEANLGQPSPVIVEVGSYNNLLAALHARKK
jgi:hypothetical protein